MKPLFTLHAGEYLVGSHIESTFRRVNLWIPARDTGVDLLVTDRHNQKTLSLQVKFSKDFLVTHAEPELQGHLQAVGWWSLNREKLAASKAEFWVLVLQGFAHQSTDCVVIPRAALLRFLTRLHGKTGNIIQTYITVTADGRCYESRGLSKRERLGIASKVSPIPKARDLTPWLNDWTPVKRLNR
ncbi:MAG: hypothetical protein KF689_08660 [Gemmatimonadaceae bacterium]|nr:hypothetical protein [Gemmatimonadaceae bacterium]MCW5826334.1 hypothetical protein [Gemmatimonadaceae bacterium]